MSDIKFACPTCQQHIQCEDGYAGREIACPTCNSKMIVPRPVGIPAAPVGAGRLRISTDAPPPSVSTPVDTEPTCPSCGSPVAARAIMCVKCGTNLRTGEQMSV